MVFLRYEFVVGIAYENNPNKATKLILETVSNVEGMLSGKRKPAVVINELATSTINIRALFWVDTFVTTRRTVHHSIRSQVMDDVVATLIANGFSLPASVIELKNYEPSFPMNPKVEIK
ncbi:MAG: mechanosensitive ion channel [Bacteroidetes bacterium]|jgi:small conductance mechanosensitive channel|nr:mechanosensitive ion channel [Bacteroidota bacterium]